jgi:O-antigen/teichoic acid export membrane protein
LSDDLTTAAAPERSVGNGAEPSGESPPAPSTELRAAALRGLRWTSIGRVIAELLLLGSMVVLARLIPPAEFGPYAVAVVAQELALGIQSQGVGNALVQRATADREHIQAGHALALLTGFALAWLMLLAATFVALPIFGAPTASLVRLTAPLCIVTAISIVPMATLRRRLEFRRLTILDMISTAFRVGGSVGLAAAGFGAKSLVFGTLAGAVVGGVGAWVMSPPPAPRLRRRAAREVLHFGGPASLASISWTCFRNCDYAIVGVRLGTLQAGLYFRAYNLGVEYQKKVSDLMVTVAFPVLSRTSSEKELSAMRGEVTRLLTMMLFPLLTLLAIVAPVLIPWFLGPAWAPVVVPTQILAIGGASTLVIDTAGVALAAAGRSRAMLGFGVAHFVAYAVAVWFVSPLGISAVAISAAVVHTAFLVVSYVLMLSRTREPALRHLWTDVAPATIASLGLAAVAVPASLALSAAHTPVLVQLMAVGLAGGIAYLVSLRIGFPGPARELHRTMARIVPLDWTPAIWRRLTPGFVRAEPDV